MSTNRRISSFSGVLLAAYFIPTWTVIAYRIMIAPIQGLWERPNISVALFVSDHLQLTSTTTARLAWLLALGRLTVVAFFAIFVCFALRALIRKTEGHEEPLAIALTIGSVISFASMILASQVGETAALRLHATEFLMMLGSAVLLLVEPPVQPQANLAVASEGLALEQSQLTDIR